MKQMAILGVLMITAWTFAGDETTKEDSKKIQGKWKTILIVQDGERVEGGGRNSDWVFSGNKLKYPNSGEENEIKLDASKEPKAIDVRVNREGQIAQEYKGIYAIKEIT